MEQHIVIGIEGLVGSGKTTMARELLKYIPNSILLHGGNIYRAVVFALLNSGVHLEDLASKTKNLDSFEILKKFHLSIQLEDRETVLYWNGKKIAEEDLQSEASSLGVSQMSQVADNQKLYEFGKSIIDQFKKDYSIILSSRDIIKMYPDVDYHFFITASLEERTRRKCIQYTKKMENKEQEEFERSIRENIEKRDELQEKAGYYKIYDQTIVIDVTKDASPQESAKKIMSHIKMPSVR